MTDMPDLNDSISIAVGRIAKMESELNAAKSELDEIENIIRAEYKKQQLYNRGYGTVSQQLTALCGRLASRNEQIIGGAKAFNQDLIVYLRAIGLVAEMVMGAGTHAEKNARMRGMIEQIETAIHKLREHDMKFTDHHYWNAPDVWRSDYPVRAYMERAYSSEEKVKQLEAEITKLTGQPHPEQNHSALEEDIPL